MGVDDVVDVGEVAEAGEVEGLSAEGLLLTAAESLKKSIEYAVKQMNTRKVRGEVKLRWSRALTKQVEALVKVAEALNRMEGKSGADEDLASYLSVVEQKVPQKFATRRLTRIIRKVRLSGPRYERRQI
jgi:porphobilinogen deaminase